MGILDDLKVKKKAGETLKWAEKRLEEIERMGSTDEKVDAIIQALKELMERLR
ncbi:MAG: hypothetical protein ACXQT3_01905 [Methermicoccaceae archaeon]